MEKNYKMRPFVKWAGGKRQLLENIKSKMPSNYHHYYEPFVGGGALLFDIHPEKAYINDINKELINVYINIKENPDAVIDLLSELDSYSCDKESYYKFRDKFNNKILNEEYDIEMSALFIFLNKRCFNGLYRVNSKGLFNVPFNNKLNVNSYEEDNIRNISKFLQNVEITCGDFEEAVKKAGKGDFVFLDSPYAPLNDNSFDSYTKMGFDLSSHQRLANVFRELDKRGCYIILTNHNTELIRKLYYGYNFTEVNVKRMINRNADKREGREVIITNFKNEEDINDSL